MAFSQKHTLKNNIKYNNMKTNTKSIEEFYLAPSCETIILGSEGMLCDSDGTAGSIDPWHFTDNPITF